MTNKAQGDDGPGPGDQPEVSLSIQTLKEYYGQFHALRSIESTRTLDYSGYFDTIGTLLANEAVIRAKNPPRLNIWEGIPLKRHGRRHCAFLAYLLDPFANHCQRELFLTCLLEHLELKRMIKYCDKGWYVVKPEDSDKETRKRPDITIRSRDFIIWIEAKIDDSEGEEQLANYLKIMTRDGKALGIDENNRRLVYLTVNRKVPKKGGPIDLLSWEEVSEICQSFSNRCQNEFVKELVSEYARFLDENLKSSEVTDGTKR